MTAATLRAAVPRAGRYAAFAFGGAAAIGASAYMFNQDNKPPVNNKPAKNLLPFLGGAASAPLNVANPKVKDQAYYQEIYNAIAKKFDEEKSWLDNYAPYGTILRNAWHASGYFSKKTGGGSFGGNLIYAPESTDGENAGLAYARDWLSEFLWDYDISRGDLYTLAGVCAVQQLGCTVPVKWRPGRINNKDRKKIPANGLLPDAAKDATYVRELFKEKGFDDRETVALIGAHALGSCHKFASGFDGPWTHSPDVFTNTFYTELLGKWYPKHIKETGRDQFEDEASHSLMMLPTDMALKTDNKYLKYVKEYAENEQLWMEDFSKACTKLFELGIDFKDAPFMEFKTYEG